MLLHSYPKFMVKCRTPWGMTVPSVVEDPDVRKTQVAVLGARMMGGGVVTGQASPAARELLATARKEKAKAKGESRKRK